MSLISKALKKAEESRQLVQEPLVQDTDFQSLGPQASPKTDLKIFWGIGIIVAILISLTAIWLTVKNSESKQDKVLYLEKTIKLQEKRINDLTNSINNDQGFSDSQRRELDFRLTKESEDLKNQINDLASTGKENYENLKEALIDDKQQIDLIDNFTKKLDQKIEAISASTQQAKEVLSPASGT